VVAFEISILKLVGPVVSYFPQVLWFDAVIFIVTISYLACHRLLLSTVMAVRGLSLKGMGLIGLIAEFGQLATQ